MKAKSTTIIPPIANTVESVMSGKKPTTFPKKSKLVSELERHLQLHYEGLGKINTLYKGIEKTINEIKALEKVEKSRSERIIKDATLIDTDKFEIKSMFAHIAVVPKYTSPQPAYKDLWNDWLEVAPKTVSKSLKLRENQMVQDKADETKQVIQFSHKNIK